MKIRSITCFYDPGASAADSHLDQLAQLASSLRGELQAISFEVQTTRLATTPFANMVPSCCDQSAVVLATTMEEKSKDKGFDYISLGPALPEFPESYRLIPQMLAATQSAFFSGIIATAEQGIHLPSVKACGQVIADAATITSDGFTNLRFGAAANVRPHGPFFPVSYHQPGQPPAFALAMEAADLVLEAFQSADSLQDARQRMLVAFQEQARKITLIAQHIGQAAQIEFLGYDFSPAPYPDNAVSLGAALESLGLSRLGQSGSLAAAAFLADALDQRDWMRAGYNGLMLPVLEDSTLARRSAEGSLTIKDLLLYSAVCGTGLDTVPIPGDSSPSQISALLLDLAALSIRLDKPLTARLMPVPNKKAGDPTEFEFSYFANGKVLELPSEGISGLLSGDEWLYLSPRWKK